MSKRPIAIRGTVVHCLDDPRLDAEAFDWHEDALLRIEDGHVHSLSPCTPQSLRTLPPDCELIDHRGRLILPGLVDTHVHYPQVDVIASWGTQLLDWLERYTFPAEMRFDDPVHAGKAAEFFLDRLLANGTTTALVFATVHPTSVEAFFEAAVARHLRMISGKVLMDRHAPAALLDTAELAYADSETLIRRWHGKDRLGYAVTPRFAPTSTEAQLRAAGRLLDNHPGVHLHTHLAENTDECAWVGELFPAHGDYLAVYEHHGLVRHRSVFAHAIHLSDDAWQRLGRAGAAVAHCPMSNLFIGSGLFDLDAARRADVRVGLGTDVGGGDSYSMLRCFNEAYKVQQLQGLNLTPAEGLYLATLGGARALDLGGHIGNFSSGKEADFIVVDDTASPALARRSRAAVTLQERLFATMMLGDERVIRETWILGERARFSLNAQLE